MNTLWKIPENISAKNSKNASFFYTKIANLFTKKVGKISPKLDYIGIFHFLEDKNIPKKEKKFL